MDISLSRVHFPVTALGPGYRLGIWFQGCSIRCSGCISSDTWASRAASSTVEKLLAHIKPWLQACEGVTISGGEPFEQPEALARLLLGIRARSAVDILVYSGKRWADIQDHAIVTRGLADCVISEPFERAQSQTRLLMGSDNQRMRLLTPLGRAVFGSLDRPTRGEDRRLDVMFDEDGAAWLAGIPARGDMARLQLILKAEGTHISTTEAKV